MLNIFQKVFAFMLGLVRGQSGRGFNAFKSAFGAQWARQAASAASGEAKGLLTLAEGAGAENFWANLKNGWWANFWFKMAAYAEQVRVMPKGWLVKGAFWSILAYELLSKDNDNDNKNSNNNKSSFESKVTEGQKKMHADSNATASTVNYFTINNVMDKHWDKYDASMEPDPNKPGEYRRRADASTHLQTLSHDSTPSTLDPNTSLPSGLLPAGQQFYIDGVAVTMRDFVAWVTVNRAYARYNALMPKSMYGHWLDLAFAVSDENGNDYLYEDGLFLDKSTSALIADEAFIRGQFDTVIAPVMRLLGLSSVSDLKPLLNLTSMDPDLFTAIEKSTKIWR